MDDETQTSQSLPRDVPPHAPSGWPDWAMTSIIGLIVAFGITVLLAQLRPPQLRPPQATPARMASPLVSIAEAAQAKSALAQTGMQFAEGDDGLQLVPFVSPAAAVAAALPQPDISRPAVPLNQQARLAIVIDDLGLKQNASLRATELPGPLTLAFLPYGENLQALADNARARGHQVIVHVPMEGAATNDPGPNALLTKLSPQELQQRIAWNLSQFTGYVGINNHMGSKFSENADDMQLVFAALAPRKLFYLDSRTTAKSTARAAAIADNIPYAERDVFLDNHQEASYVAVQLAEAEMLARRHGNAIAIGHPHQVTLDTLEKWIPTLAAKGIELVPVSTIITDRASPKWRQVAYRDGGRG